METGARLDPARARTATARGIGLRFIAFRTFGDLIPIYPLYAVLFAASGLSSAQISSLLVLWSAATLLLEVPSGAWADVVSRRALLAVGALSRSVGFTLWVLQPSIVPFAIGFLLWALGSALRSGTLQALIYDELTALGVEQQYQRWAALAQTGSLIGNVAATLTAAPLFALWGYLGVGLVSGVSCVLAAAVAMSFPPRPRRFHTECSLRSWLAMLRAGLSEVHGHVTLRRLVILAAVLSGLFAIDEFFPLLAAGTGVPTWAVPLLVLLPVAGQLTGSTMAVRPVHACTVGVGLAAAGVLTAVGALSGSAWGFAPLAIGYGLMQHAIVVAEAQLQHTVRGPARATVSSVTGLFAELIAIGCYLAWGGAATTTGTGAAIALLCLPLPVLAVLAVRWLASSRSVP